MALDPAEDAGDPPQAKRRGRLLTGRRRKPSETSGLDPEAVASSHEETVLLSSSSEVLEATTPDNGSQPEPTQTGLRPRAGLHRAGAPRQVGRYAIQQELARGGMGIVLAGYHAELQRPVAIKLLHPEFTGDDVAEERFLREARAAASLRHPGIVQVHDVGRDGGHVYLVMDLIEGESLKQRLEREGVFPPVEAARLVAEIAEAVGYAHAEGILHRDLKPHNVMLDPSGRALLTDFGLAKVLEPDGQPGSGARKRSARLQVQLSASSSASGPDLTAADEILGTPHYMAPEQIDPERAPVSPATDVYALGVVLYQCLIGELPFQASGIGGLFRQILAQPAPDLGRINPQLDPDLGAIVARCLAKDPRQRYRNGVEVARELARWQRGVPPIGVTPVTEKQRAPERIGAGPLVGLLLALGLGLGGYALSQASSAEEPGSPGPGDGSVGVAESPPLGDGPSPSPSHPPEPGAGPPRDVFRAGGSVPSFGGAGTREERARRAAVSGNLEARAEVGYRVLTGEWSGDRQQAEAWLDEAARSGQHTACLVLGTALTDGQLGLAKDPARGRELLRQGIEAGSLECALILGTRLAAAGDPEAREVLERAVSDGDGRRLHEAGVVLLRTASDEHEQVGFHYLERALAAGETRAKRVLAHAYRLGLGVRTDVLEGQRLLRAASEEGDPEAIHDLGQAYLDGSFGLAVDVARGRGLLEQALAAGSQQAEATLEQLREGE